MGKSFFSFFRTENREKNEEANIWPVWYEPIPPPIYFTHLSSKLKIEKFIWLTLYGKDVLDINPSGKLELIGNQDQLSFPFFVSGVKVKTYLIK